MCEDWHGNIPHNRFKNIPCIGLPTKKYGSDEDQGGDNYYTEQNRCITYKANFPGANFVFPGNVLCKLSSRLQKPMYPKLCS